MLWVPLQSTGASNEVPSGYALQLFSIECVLRSRKIFLQEERRKRTALQLRANDLIRILYDPCHGRCSIHL